MRIIRRGFYGIITLALVAAFFIPRPIFKPDWKGAITEAIAQGKCDQAEMILFAADWFDMPGYEEFEARVQNRGECGFEPLASDANLSPEQRIAEAIRRDQFLDSNLPKQILETSWAKHLIFTARLATKPGAFKDLELFLEEVSLSPPCILLEASVFNAHPKYQLMRRVVTHADDSWVAIRAHDEYRILQDNCASRYLDLAKKHIIRGNHATQDTFLLRLFKSAEDLSYKNHNIDLSLAKWRASILEANEDGVDIPKQTLEFVESRSVCPPLIAFSPWANFCANYVSETANADGGDLAKIFYHVRLAERWGNNLPELKEKTLEKMSDTCRTAVEKALRKDVADFDQDHDIYMVLGPDTDFLGYKSLSSLPECQSAARFEDQSTEAEAP